MAFVSAPNIIECQVRCTWDGQQIMNRFHAHVDSGPTEAQCAFLASEVAAWWIANVKALVPATLSLREVFCKGLELENDVQATFSSGLPSAGTSGADSCPNNVALCCSLRTGLTGRSAHGRWYWAGLCESQVTGSTIASGTVASIVATLDALRNVLLAAGLNWMVVSFNHNGGPRAGGPVYFEVNDILAIDGIVDSQRKRLPGRGN